MMFNAEEKQLIQSHFDRQNGLAAAATLSLISVPIMLAWMILNTYLPNASGLMIAVVGVLTGFATRLSGNAVSRDFSVLSVFSYLCNIVLAFGIYEVGIGPIHMGLFLLLVVFGAYLSVLFSKRKLPPADSELMNKHRLMGDFQPKVTQSNRWWLMLFFNGFGLIIFNALAFDILRLMIAALANE